MPRPAARVLLPCLALAASLALGACGTDGDTAASSPTAPAGSATTVPQEPSPSAAPEPTVTPDDAEVVAITVAGGQVSGVEPRTEIPAGSTVRLSITSDVADEVHVHGYDLTQSVAAGETVQLEFVADNPGVFEVEFHDSGTVLTRLQVQ